MYCQLNVLKDKALICVYLAITIKYKKSILVDQIFFKPFHVGLFG